MAHQRHTCPDPGERLTRPVLPVGRTSGTLRTHDAPLSTIARDVGGISEFAFAKTFEREYGTAPGTYRRNNTRDFAPAEHMDITP
ncbi:hypothetical protein OG948_15105 [Embleya sp. NBC_00888]|uniref:hypothetical protein n=1 Tax=Embleya sp. NBC_00888 TaxID=2975960 RepID=UPI00386E8835|nr:hypothetical protein OG948_15105 [Embleya sp. NBC_00888]